MICGSDINPSFYRYDVKFVGMVLPGDEPTVKLHHIGMQDGNIVVNIETSRLQCPWREGIQGSAEVSQPNTVYVFTGQGSQESGMGMDLYNSPPAARAVWEGADAHLLAVYGFSIVEISRTIRRKRRFTSAVSKVRLFDNVIWT